MPDAAQVRESLREAIQLQKSDLRKAIELSETAYSVAASLTEPELLAHAAYVHGSLLRLSGAYSRAESRLSESLSLYDRLNITEPKLYIQLGQLYVELSRSAEAIECFERALAIYNREQYPLQRADTMLNLANAYVITHHPGARQAYDEAMMLYTILENELGLALTLSNMGGLFQSSGQHESAVTSFKEASRILASKGENRSKGIVLQKLADSYLAIGEFSSALSSIEEALSIAGRLQLSSLRVYSLRTQAAILKKQGNEMEADGLLEEADALAAVLGMK